MFILTINWGLAFSTFPAWFHFLPAVLLSTWRDFNSSNICWALLFNFTSLAAASEALEGATDLRVNLESIPLVCLAVRDEIWEFLLLWGWEETTFSWFCTDPIEIDPSLSAPLTDAGGDFFFCIPIVLPIMLAWMTC